MSSLTICTAASPFLEVTRFLTAGTLFLTKDSPQLDSCPLVSNDKFQISYEMDIEPDWEMGSIREEGFLVSPAPTDVRVYRLSCLRKQKISILYIYTLLPDH